MLLAIGFIGVFNLEYFLEGVSTLIEVESIILNESLVNKSLTKTKLRFMYLLWFWNALFSHGQFVVIQIVIYELSGVLLS